MRAIKAVGVLVAAGLTTGCNEPQLDGFAADFARQMEPAIREEARRMIAEEIGPMLLTSWWHPSPGQSALPAGTDAGWRICQQMVMPRGDTLIGLPCRTRRRLIGRTSFGKRTCVG